MLRTYISDVYSAATRKKRELRFFPFSTGRPLFVVLAIAAAAIGTAILLLPRKPADYEPYREETVRLAGTVCGLEPKLQEDIVVWQMILSDVRIESPAAESAAHPEPEPQTSLGLDKKDKVLCILDYEPGVDMSARVRVRGKLYPFRSAMNEGEFDLRMYYHILRIEFSLRSADLLAASAPTDRLAAVLFRLKNHISSMIDRLFSEENSPVLKAMLLGEKGLLQAETKELYQGAGIIHVLSISGLHLSLLGMGLYSAAGKCRLIPLPVRAAISITAVFLYGKMIGMGTSVFRALIMLTLYIISKVIGRTYDLLTAASIAAFLLLLDQPLYLLHTGFQFSFSAVMAIGILLPALPGRSLKAVAIPLATLPVYLWAYGTFPVTSLLLNLIVIPLMTVVMISAGGALLLTLPAEQIGFVSQGMTDSLPSNGELPFVLRWIVCFLGLPAELILDFYRFLAESSEKIPGHEIVLGRPSPIRIFLFYGMLVLLAALSVRLQMPHMRRRIEAEAVSLRKEACSLRASLRPEDFPLQASLHSKDSTPKTSLRPEGSPIRRASLRPEDFPLRASLRPEDSPLRHEKLGCRNENRIDLFLRRAASKTCHIFHLRDNRSRKYFACIFAALWISGALLVLIIHPRPAFEMDMLYVGQGDGIFISCKGRNFLIDGGSSTKEDLAKYTILPFLHNKGIGRLDGIILTHDDIDHCSGLLEFLEAAEEEKEVISISALYLPDIAESAKGENYKRIENLSGRAGIPVHYISRGQRIRSGDLTLDCLHPARDASYEDANEYSTTLLLRYGPSSNSLPEDPGFKPDLPGKTDSFSALLTGDLEGQGETDFLQYLAETKRMQSTGDETNLDILKVAHHGSRNATSTEFLQAVRPNTAIISAGIDNMYGHPAEELLNRLKISFPQPDIYRTDQQGEISFRPGKKGGYGIRTFLDD